MSVGLLLSSIMSSGGAAPPPTGDANIASVVLLMEMYPVYDEGPGGNNLFGDHSSTTVSRTDPRELKPGIFSSLGGLINDDRLELFTSFSREATALDLGSSNFCLEAWVKNSVEPTENSYIAGTWDIAQGSRRSFVLFYAISTNQITATVRIVGNTEFTATFDLDTDGVTLAQFFDNNWHHVAMTRTGDTLRVFVDGILGGVTATITAAAALNTSVLSNYNFRVGSITTNFNEENSWKGAIDELRLTSGVARYSAAFTPPTAIFPRDVAGDADYASVLLLTGFANPAGIWTYPNDLPEPRVPISIMGELGYNGNSTIQGIWFPPKDDWNLGSGNFTIELFGITAYTTMDIALGHGSGASGNIGWSVRSGNGSRYSFVYSDDGTVETTAFSSSTSQTADTEHDIAIVRSGTDLHLFIDGVLDTTEAISGSIFNPQARLGIGNGFDTNDSVNTSFNWIGKIRAIRITKGVARHTAAYTVPTLPLPLGEPIVNTDRMWRVRVLTHSNTRTSVAEIEFRTVVGVAEWNKSGTPFASSIRGDSYMPIRAFDRTTSIRWSSFGSGESWIAYDFAETKVCLQLAISVPLTSEQPLTFVVDKSTDGVTWTAVTGTITPAAWTANVLQIFTLADHPV